MNFLGALKITLRIWYRRPHTSRKMWWCHLVLRGVLRRGHYLLGAIFHTNSKDGVDDEYFCTIILQWTNIARYTVDWKRTALVVLIYRNCCTANTECILSYFIVLELLTKWENNIWFLLHDNVPAYLSVSVLDLLAKNNVTILVQPPQFL